ncbi:hypothetical protein VA7868_00128 [Vibrio aerogenes CECT 7868]|uniref:Uncharacterized protein n=1 Tax=Vibrio aerogenes CECT 7868 TaxID=1216006 RepID=A0A1M5UMT7_9VIBR|nr:hypothetical protein [Vibrio aerogenes]SHH64279.1 hypothetical protein VA7868_00128 [Vibrio aerogenes CECT 7868]
MKSILLVILGLFLSCSTYATTHAGTNQIWHGPFTITKLARYYDGAHRMTVHVAETPNTTCSVTNEQKMATYHYDNNSDFSMQMFSILATAQAQNKKVMLLLDHTCAANYGLNVHGVEILSN